jgi:3,4-dihydroxy 2-butanone 4-phosphate synthase/GTP cyclohydrolase II
MSAGISTVPEIISDLREGRMVILIDEEDRENEGDLVLAAEFATPDNINFMARYGRGLICLTLTAARCRQLNLGPMVGANRSRLGTNFTVSIEAAEGVTTGISAADRATTILAAVSEHAGPADIVQPGHIFPLRAEEGGVLVRAGHTEAGCDLAAMANVEPAAVICEILRDDGEMARLPDLIKFGETHDLKIGTIADLIHHRSRTETLVERAMQRPIETAFGEFELIAYREKVSGNTHLVLIKGELQPGEETLVRVHEPLSVADVLDIGSPMHSWHLNDAMKTISDAGNGVLVLLHRTEDGEQLLAHLDDTPRTAPKLELRNYGIGAQILRDIGVTRMRLLAAPRRMPSMAGFDLEITGYLQPR